MKSLRSLDYRDLQAWLREAQIKNTSERIMQIQAVRFGMVDEAAYGDAINELKLHLDILQFGKDAVVQRSIEELKAMKSG